MSTAIALRDAVVRLEDAIYGGINEGELLEVKFPLRHFFAKGVYLRQMCAPAGTVATGKIHNFTQIHIILVGEVTIKTVGVDGGAMRVKGPYIWTAPAGAKRACYFHEDTVWCEVHGTDKTDVDDIESEFISQSFEEFDRLPLQLELEA
jgi:hypothetical protein